MNGDFTDRCLEQWADEELDNYVSEEFPGMLKEIDCHIQFVKEPASLKRLFLGTLRRYWWNVLLTQYTHLVSKNKQLESRVELLTKQNRNLRKKGRK